MIRVLGITGLICGIGWTDCMTQARKSSGGRQKRRANEGGNYEGRISYLEAQMEHTATRAWVLGGVIAGILAALGLILAALRILGWGPPTS